MKENLSPAYDADEQAQRPIKKPFSSLNLVALNLFILLFFNGLYHGWHWVLIVFFVVMAISITVPHRYRISIYLMVCIIAILLVLWVAIPEKSDGQWRPYSFVTEPFQEEEPASVSELNAAKGYKELFQSRDWKSISDQLLIYDPNNHFFRNFWVDSDHPELSTYLTQFLSDIEQLQRTAELTECRFEVFPSFEGLNHCSQQCHSLLMAVKILVLQANREIGNGFVETGIDRYLSLLNTAEHLCRQPLSYYYLLGLGFKQLSYSQMNSYLMTGNSDSNFALELKTRLQNDEIFTLDDKWEGYVTIEKLHTTDTLARAYLVDKDFKIRFNLFAMTGSVPMLQSPGWKNMASTLNGAYSRLGVIVGWLVCAPRIENVFQRVDNAYDELSVWTEFILAPSPQRRRRTFNFSDDVDSLIQQNTHFIRAFYVQQCNTRQRYKTIVAGNELLCDIWLYKNQYGCYPDKLQDAIPVHASERLVDPCNGQEFVYRREGSTFVLYSKGFNATDDSGQWKRKEEITDFNINSLNKIDQHWIMVYDDISIWPRREPEKPINIDFLLETNF